MNKEIINLESCLKGMERCLKITNVENCICFSDAFKVLNAEVDELFNKIYRFSDKGSEEKLKLLKNKIEEVQRNIFKGTKECLGCSPCIASAVFKSYPDRLNSLYLENKL